MGFHRTGEQPKKPKKPRPQPALKTLVYVVETTCPENRDSEELSAPFSTEANAWRYVAAKIWEEISEDRGGDEETKSLRAEIHQALYDGDYVFAHSLWMDNRDVDNDLGFTIHAYTLNEDLPKDFKIPPPPPSQDAINEGINLVQESFADPRQMHPGPRGFRQVSGVRAYMDRKIIATTTGEKQIFRLLRARREELSSPRIFSVNDHGNVTEYDYQGRVIGEWV